MADPFIGQISLFGFPFAPRGWAQCNGQTLAIAQNQALFSLLGTIYGGNGQTTFKLPDFQERVVMHAGAGYVPGQVGGEAAVTLTQDQIPQHSHQAFVTSVSTSTVNTPTGSVLNAPAEMLYTPYTKPEDLVAIDASTLTNAGSSQPHENRQPYTVVNFCIALQGMYPSRN